MSLKARRVVRELAEVPAGGAGLPARRLARAGRPAGSRGHRRDRTGLYRRHDRPLRARRARSPVQAEPGPGMNPFARAARRWCRGGAPPAGATACCRPSSTSGRVAVEPPRDPAHGEAATNAALVLAKAAGKPPMALAAQLAAALAGRTGEIARVGSAAPGFVNLTMAPGFWQRQVRGRARGRRRLRPQRARRAAAGSTSSSARPTRPARSTSATAAAPCSATRWPTSWTMPASP